MNYGIKVNNRLAFLLADQQRGDFPPTDQAWEVFEQESNALDSILEELRKLTDDQIGNFNLLLKEAGQGYISLPEN